MIILGYLQIIVGFVNVLGCIVRLCIKYTRNAQYKKKLNLYLGLVAVYFTLLFLGTHLKFNNDVMSAIAMLYIFVVPWILAFYYWSIIYGPKEIAHVEES